MVSGEETAQSANEISKEICSPLVLEFLATQGRVAPETVESSAGPRADIAERTVLCDWIRRISQPEDTAVNRYVVDTKAWKAPDTA